MGALTASGCSDDKDESRVWGTMRTDRSAVYEVRGGVLANEEADHFGYCTFENNSFSFSVATAPKAQLGSNSNLYEILGISGKPSKNPYDASGEPRTDEARTFAGGTIRSEDGHWSFGSKYIIPERCKVVLFAEAGEGDLTPTRYGKNPFEYLVKLDCPNGLDQVPNKFESGVELGGLQLELWFDNCD
jgi:hypothetical protein